MPKQNIARNIKILNLIFNLDKIINAIRKIIAPIMQYIGEILTVPANIMPAHKNIADRNNGRELKIFKNPPCRCAASPL